jgi:hypothetical protein
VSRRLIIGLVIALGCTATPAWADDQTSASGSAGSAGPGSAVCGSAGSATADGGSAASAASPAGSGSGVVSAEANAGSNAGSASDTPLASSSPVGQAIGAELGLAAGGHVTPGGLRVAGNFAYQLSDRDWFDGIASFTFGSGAAQCFYDRMDNFICQHGLTDGYGVELSANIRHYFDPKGQFHPFARGGVGAGIVRFADDAVTGFVIPAHGGGGFRVDVDPVAVVVQAEVIAGIGWYGHDVGVQAVFGAAVTAGVEFPLR